MELSALVAVAQITTAVILIVGVVLAVHQMRESRLHRRALAAVELMHSVQDTEFTRAFRAIYMLPAELTAQELRRRGPEFEEAAQLVGVRFETLGLLTHRGVVPFDFVDDLTGGAVVALWSRVRDWVEAVRKEQAQPTYLEWFQWLAEQFVRRGRPSQAPAYLRYQRWRPSLIDTP
jgi:hypothetical protein